MSKKVIQIEESFLQKVAEFASVMIKELSTLRSQVNVGMQKEAGIKDKNDKYFKSLQKVAKVLYDTDFITDEIERHNFLKLASEDPSYLAKVLEKVCNANDVGSFAKVAHTSVRKNTAAYDPVYARAFGYNNYDSILDD